MNNDATETFHGVVDQVLRDIARAQLAADRRSEQMAEIYSKTPILRSFPVPCLQISAVDIDLRYALVLCEDEPEEPPESPASSERAITSAANRLADATVKFVETLSNLGHCRAESERAGKAWLGGDSLAEYFERSLSALAERGELTSAGTDSLTTGTEPWFDPSGASQDSAGASQTPAVRLLGRVDAKLSTARREAALTRLFCELWQALAERDPLLCERIDSDPGIEELRLQVVAAWLPIIEELERRLSGEDGSTSENVPPYAVILDARQLAELPAEAVSSVSLHIDLAGGSARNH